MKIKAVLESFAAVVLVAMCLSNANARSNFFTGPPDSSQACSECHGATTTCAGCHAHGTHSGNAKNDINVVATTDKAVYAPGETVTVSITGSYRPGWVRAKLWNQDCSAEGCLSSGSPPGGPVPVDVASNTCASCLAGVGGADGVTSEFPGPVILTAPAPSNPGTHTWSASWYGNNFDLGRIGGSTTFGDLWLDDPGNADHGDEIVTFSFEVQMDTTTTTTATPTTTTTTATPTTTTTTATPTTTTTTATPTTTTTATPTTTTTTATPTTTTTTATPTTTTTTATPTTTTTTATPTTTTTTATPTTTTTTATPTTTTTTATPTTTTTTATPTTTTTTATPTTTTTTATPTTTTTTATPTTTTTTATPTTTTTTLVPVFDLDITAFRVTKRVRLDSNKDPVVSIKLVVKNNSTVPGTTIASIEGVQGERTLVSFSEPVSDAVGNGSTTLKLGYLLDESVVPDTIEWTASFDDGDPDTDAAFALTTVR